MIVKAAFAAAIVALAGPAAAQELPLPRGATRTFDARDTDGRYALPTGPWREDSGIPVRMIEGVVVTRAWRLPAGLSPQQVVRPIREALSAAGWDIVLDCEAARCGGFDFRFGTQVVPAPAMFIDLRDYRVIAATRPEGGGVTAIASGDDAAGYLQIIRAGLPESAEDADAPAVGGGPAAPDGDLIERLERSGSATLRDLDYASGDAGVGDGAVGSLDRLAEYLRAHPDRRILFVGHTDATGTLDANRALSRQRAQAAADYLRARHDTDPAQIDAEGAGYLAPAASNLTEAGRRANRRVDAVLLPRD